MLTSKYYDLAGEIVLKLNSRGKSSVKSHLNQHFNEYEQYIQKNVKSEEDIERLYTDAKNLNDIYKHALRYSGLKAFFLFLIAIDIESGNVASFDLDASVAIALNKTNTDEIEVYLTYPGVDRDSKVNDEYTCLFKNLIYYVKGTKEYKKLKIKNVYLNLNKNKIRIGFTPYPYSGEELFERVGKGLVGKSRDRLDKYDEKYIKACKALLEENNCDIIFGPEIHGSEVLDAELKNIMIGSCCGGILGPSYHHRLNNGIVINQSTAYIRQHGHILSEKLDKFHKAIFGNGNVEGLTYEGDETEHQVILLHIRNIGRILLLICKDFLTNTFKELIKSLNVDIVLLQCYTPSLTEFESLGINEIYKRLVLVGNSCSGGKNLRDDDGDRIHPFFYCEYDYDHSRAATVTKVKTFKCKECKYENKCCKVLEIVVEEIDDKQRMITQVIL